MRYFDTTAVVLAPPLASLPYKGVHTQVCGGREFRDALSGRWNGAEGARRSSVCLVIQTLGKRKKIGKVFFLWWRGLPCGCAGRCFPKRGAAQRGTLPPFSPAHIFRPMVCPPAPLSAPPRPARGACLRVPQHQGHGDEGRICMRAPGKKSTFSFYKKKKLKQFFF